MAMSYGTESGGNVAVAGMSAGIYAIMDDPLSPPLQEAVDGATDDAARDGAQTALDEARKGWKKLSYAVAKGVIDHLTGFMEIQGVQTTGTVNINISGNTGNEPGHVHSVNLSDSDTPTFNQITGTGSVI